jgi:hypothetical protein
MKVSELIRALEAIDKDVPFDSDVVTGCDWMPNKLVGVSHDPPFTFLDFERNEEVETPNDFASFLWRPEEAKARLGREFVLQGVTP